MIRQFLVVIALLFCFKGSIAQEKPMHEIHVAMLYNFVKYVQWPDETATGTFVIGVIGDEQVFSTLKAWYDGKPKGAKKFEIRQLESPTDAAGCQVVYIGKAKSKELENIRSGITNRPVLTITNGEGLAKKGSCINFRLIDGKLRFELNAAELTSSNLKVSSALTSMAILI